MILHETPVWKKVKLWMKLVSINQIAGIFDYQYSLFVTMPVVHRQWSRQFILEKRKLNPFSFQRR